MARRTDVVIVGSGSAGLCAAAWLAIYNIPFTILERRPGPMEIGQADGVQCRTVEIYESFGLSEELLREAYHILEVCFWGIDEECTNRGIKRTSRTIDTENGLSHLPHVILNQARMNGLLLGKMEQVLREKNGRGGVEYGCRVTDVHVESSRSRDLDAHCVRVTAERHGREEIWEAKYVLGCDGAHSIVRKSLGYRMLGDSSDTIWGVMDIYPRTNFPDIRRKSTIHSAAGNLVIIPREGGQLVRFYIQLLASSNPKDVTLDDLQDAARRIFAPYEMEFAGCYWWSTYSIGQRLAEQFHRDTRVFLTGDACHTHSPKAGQGMNVSLQDGYNIGWKLGSVLRGLSPPSILQTYVAERSKTAADLIAFDKELAQLFNRQEAYPGEFAEYFTKSGRYMAGFTARYQDSVVTRGGGIRDNGGDVAKGLSVGMRFPSAQVVRFCDCKAVQLQRVLQSDGRWRILIFAGDITQLEARSRLHELAAFLENLIQRFTPPTADIDSVIEPILVLSSKFQDTEQELIPDFFWPVTGKWRIRDLHKTYIDDTHYNSGHGHAYAKYGVDPNVGAAVIVRPDQYISQITPASHYSAIASFFAGCMLEQGHEELNAVVHLRVHEPEGVRRVVEVPRVESRL